MISRLRSVQSIFRPRYVRCIQRSASDKLFADAELEEAESPAAKPSSKLTFLERQHENWTGEENIEDSVLRMLVDKYKPLRSGTIRTAEQKMKDLPPRIALSETPIADHTTTRPFSVPSSGSWSTENLIPAKEGHKPWLTEYHVPSHAASSIKFAHIPPTVIKTKITSTDERLLKKAKETRKRTDHVGRLHRARENTLDYQLGIKSSSGGRQGGRTNPVSIKGWTGLIEEKIEKARQAGLFNSVKGRGKPLARNIEESNPFIGREEFLMNRIVQRNGAAPPWVEIQGELDVAVSTFRDILRQSWIRRAIRNLTTLHPAAILSQFTIHDLKDMRDVEWEHREHKYHETAIEEVNALVRKYNGVAPYAVRRPYYVKTVELERMYNDCHRDILQGIQSKVSSGPNMQKVPLRAHDVSPSMGFRELFQRLIDQVAQKWKGF